VVPKRDLAELVIFSARPWEFFVPMIYHPVFGKYTFDFIMSHLHGSNPYEQTIYLGYFPLLLAILAVYKGRNKFKEHNLTDQESFSILFSLALIVTSLLFMSPAYIQLGDIKVPSSLSYFLFEITSIFRVMARFDVLIMLAIAILASIGLKYLTKRKVAIFIILVLIMLEYTPMPVQDPLRLAIASRPYSNFPYSEENYQGYTTILRIPEVYYWLAKQDNATLIAEYPMVDAASEYDCIYYRYLFYQRIHKKSIINGEQPGPRELNKLLYNLDESTINILDKLGVDYILVHGHQKIQSQRLRAVRYSENITVYKISNQNTSCDTSFILMPLDGWYGIENWNGIPTRWIASYARMLVYSEENDTARISLDALSFSKPRTLIISTGNSEVIEKEIPLGFTSITGLVSLKRGFNILELSVPEGCSSPIDFPELNNKDVRCLSLAIQNLTFSKT
jgi:hypothetical protein